jgi:hypothetical protein
MKTDKNIASLLEKFMAGTTTVEEEDRLAEFFRNGEVPDEWADYKEMFAYFDDGMPAQKQKETTFKAHLSRNRYRLTAVFLAAASIALLFFLTFNKGGKAPQPQNTLPQVAQLPDTNNVEIDTVKVIAKPQKKVKRTISHRQYIMKTPRPLMADAEETDPTLIAGTVVTDSATMFSEQLMLCQLEVEKAEAELQRCFEMLDNGRIEINGVAFLPGNNGTNASENEEDEDEETSGNVYIAY